MVLGSQNEEDARGTRVTTSFYESSTMITRRRSSRRRSGLAPEFYEPDGGTLRPTMKSPLSNKCDPKTPPAPEERESSSDKENEDQQVVDTQSQGESSESLVAGQVETSTMTR